MGLLIVSACSDPTAGTDSATTTTTAATDVPSTTGSSGQSTGTTGPTTGTAPTSTSTADPSSTSSVDPSSTSGDPTGSSGASFTTHGSDSDTSGSGTTQTSTGTTDASSSGTTGEPVDDFTPLSLEVADFDGDGEDDLLVMGVDPALNVDGRLRLGFGDGTFAPVLDLAIGGASAYPAIGALDDVAGVDVMVLEGTTGVSIHRWQTDDLIHWKTLFGLAPARTHVAADFDGDDHNDILVLWNTDTSFGITLHRGTGTFFWPLVNTLIGKQADVMLAPATLLVGRLDGDAFADALVFEPDKPGFVRVFGTLAGTFTLPGIVLPELRPWVADLADFDEDGALDLVVAEQQPPRLSLATGTGTGGFALATTLDIAAPFVPWALDVTDLDGDGHLDVVAVDADHPELLVWSGAGDGILGPPAATALPSGAISVHAALLDGDVVPDLVVATFAAGDVTVLLSP